MSHASIAALTAYAGGGPELDAAAVWAVEAHLDGCAHCRLRLVSLTVPDHAVPGVPGPVRGVPGPVRGVPGPAAPPGAPDPALPAASGPAAPVAADPAVPGVGGLAAPDPGVPDAGGRAAQAVGVPALPGRAGSGVLGAADLALLAGVREAILREARTGPAPAPLRILRPAHRWAGWSALGWSLLAVAVVLAALLLDRAYPARPSLVLLLSPVAPLAGLAAAWSRRTDPAWELLAGTARAGLELMLRRTLLVLAPTLPVLAVAGTLLGTAPALWLLPSLTFTAATLWLGGRIGVPRAAALLAGGWALLVVAPAMVTLDVPPLLGSGGVPGWAAAAVICTVLALSRADGFLRLRSWR